MKTKKTITRKNATPIKSMKNNASGSNRQATMAKVALISLIGAGVAVLSKNQTVSDYIDEKTDLNMLKPYRLAGTVNKTLEQFSFTTEQGVQYHIYDPNNVLEELAKKRGIHHTFYELHRVRVKGLISKAGNYGHMGYYEHQLTIIELAE